MTNASGQRIAGQGNTVSVHYRGTLDNGEEFDTSRDKDPLTFVVGSGQLIDGFDQAVRGMAVGETKTFTIPPEDAYGNRDDAPPETVPVELLPEGVEIGDEFELESGYDGRLISIEGEYAWVQLNHQLAGETLTFEIEVVDIQ